MKILLVDDELDMLTIIRLFLEKEGYEVRTATNGSDAREIFQNEMIELVVLDWMLPVEDGISICRALKKQKDVPIILLTAKSEIEDELVALESGADDFVRKPFHPKILLLRIQRLLPLLEKELFHDIEILYNKQSIMKNGIEVILSKREWDLFLYFHKHAGLILSREQLLDSVWGYDFSGNDRTVDTHINRLREKIGAHLLHTYRGKGYRMVRKDEKI